MYIYEERGLDKTGETNRELDCEYLFLFLCGFCCLDGIAGVLPDFFQNPLQFNGTGIAFGDKILVDKWTGGARLFNIFASLRGEEVDIYRLPGFGSFQAGRCACF